MQIQGFITPGRKVEALPLPPPLGWKNLGWEREAPRHDQPALCLLPPSSPVGPAGGQTAQKRRGAAGGEEGKTPGLKAASVSSSVK